MPQSPLLVPERAQPFGSAQDAIAQWLQATPMQQTSCAHLCQSLAMPRVEVWLGVLLGEFDLEAGEEFYSDAL